MKKYSFILIAAILISSCGTPRAGIDSAFVGETVSNSDPVYNIPEIKPGDSMTGYTNIFDFMRGKVPGVYIGPAAPGSMPDIIIRGKSSILSSNQALIVVDGMETADITDLNPQDVHSIKVLKDSSASLYGVRGANGVIEITTKGAQESRAREAEEKAAAREAARAEAKAAKAARAAAKAAKAAKKN